MGSGNQIKRLEMDGVELSKPLIDALDMAMMNNPLTLEYLSLSDLKGM